MTATKMPKPPRRVKALSCIDDLIDAPYNPRKISPEAYAGLKTSLVKFGDLSGITWNKRTGNLVAGHQRFKALKEIYAGKLEIVERDGEYFLLPSKSDAPTQSPNAKKLTAKEREEAFKEAWPIRVVDWDRKTEQLANIVANNPYITGEFTEDVREMLQDAEKLFDDFSSLRLDELLADCPEIEPQSSPRSGKTRKNDTPPSPGKVRMQYTCPKCNHSWSGKPK